MTVRATAKRWMTYVQGNTFSDNRPVPMRRCLQLLPAGVAPADFVEALRMVSGESYRAPTLQYFLDWMRDNPAAIQLCNDYLASKKPPQALYELFDKAYRAELLKVRNHITSFIETEVLT